NYQQKTFLKRKYLLLGLVILVSLIIFSIIVSNLVSKKQDKLFPVSEVTQQVTNLESATKTQLTSSISQLPQKQTDQEIVSNPFIKLLLEPNWTNFSNFLNYANETKKSEENKKRISDIEYLSSLIKTLLAENKLNLKPRTVYLSFKDIDRNCKSHLNVLPKLPKGWVYSCSNNPENAQGQGWIPINFKGLGLSTSLPIDPVNEYPYIYTLVFDKNKNYELTVKLDLKNSLNENENEKIFSLGTMFNITPSVIKYR
ncbi:MAG: hypothetical protein C4347_01970, partial [Patescibacteria group bacterium]